MLQRPVALCPQAQPLLQAHSLAPLSAWALAFCEPGRLHILQGRVWLTFSGAGPTGDHFLSAGDSLQVSAGAYAVMEPYPAQPVRWAVSPAVQSPPLKHPLPNPLARLFQALRRWVAGVCLGVRTAWRGGLRAARAASSASRAQRSISAGDSSASAGGVW